MKKWVLPNKEGYITLEFTNHCNLDCVMCDTGKIPTGRRHHLDFSLFKKIIDDIAISKFEAGTIVPFWLGEPMMNPSFAEMVGYASERLASKKIQLEIHTNASFLTPAVTKKLFELNSKIVKRIILSLDAATAETYNQIRRNGNFERVTQNIKGFVEARKNNSMHEPLLVFQFIAMAQNLKEKDRFIDFWSKYLLTQGIAPKIVFSERDYPGDRDCIFIRKLDTSALYSVDSRAVYAIASGEKQIGESELFNVIVPFFRLRDKIPENIYETLSQIPKEFLDRCSNFLDLNAPNSNFNEKALAGLVDGETRLNIGFSSGDNFDNLIDVFSAFKRIDPFMRNLLVFCGRRENVPKSIFIDVTLVLEDFAWENILKPVGEIKHEPEKPNALLLMPEIYSTGDNSAIVTAIKGFLQLKSTLHSDSVDLNLNPLKLEELVLLIKKNKYRCVIICNKYPASNAVQLGEIINSSLKSIEVFYWENEFERSYFLYPSLRGFGKDVFKNNTSAEKLSPIKHLSGIVILPKIYGYELNAEEIDVTEQLSAELAKESSCEFINLHFTGRLPPSKKLSLYDFFIVSNLSQPNNSSEIVGLLKERSPDSKVAVLEHAKGRIQSTAAKSGVDVVVLPTMAPEKILSALNAEHPIPGAGYAYGKTVVVSPDVIGKDKIRNDAKPIVLVSPLFFELNRFPEAELNYEGEIIGGIERNGLSEKGPKYHCHYFNSNLQPESKLFEIIKSGDIKHVIIVNHFGHKTDTFGLSERLKKKFPQLLIFVEERSKQKVKPTSYKKDVDLVLYGVDWSKLPLELLLIDLRWFSDAWYKKASLKEDYLYFEFEAAGKMCRIIQGKHRLEPETSFHPQIIGELQNTYFGKSGTKKVLIVPKVFDVNFEVKDILNMKKHFSNPGSAWEMFDFNLSDIQSIKTVINRSSLIAVSNFGASNNSFEIIEEIKKANSEKKVIIIEHNPKKLRESASKQSVDFVVSSSSVGKFLEIFPDPECLLIPGTAYRYGSNVIVSPVGKSGAIVKPREELSLSLFGFEPVTSCSLIVPKFYEKYPAGVYELARSYYTAGKKFSYQDGNIIPIKPHKQVNCGLYLEGFKNNLMDVFGIAKKSNPDVRNCVIYYGNDVTSARKLLLHPHVDCLIYSSGTTPVFLKSFLAGKASLSEISIKYGGNVINPNLLPGPLPKINKTLTSSDLALSTGVDGGKLASSIDSLFRSDSVAIILPKYYSSFSKGVYKTAEGILKAIPEAVFADFNFFPNQISSKINFGIWIEGSKCSLIDLFSSFKKESKKVKNIVIYLGTKLHDAMDVFTNPAVDAILFSNGALTSKVRSIKNGNCRIEGFMFKHQGNMIKFGDLLTNSRQDIFNKWEEAKESHLFQSILLSQRTSKVIIINPFKWHSASWNRFGPTIWKGDELYKQGLSSAFGDDYGYFEYLFDCPLQGAQRFDIFAKVSSHSHKEGKMPDAPSDVTLMINGKEIETRMLYFESNRSNFIDHWKVKRLKLKSKGNSLTFRIKETAKHRKGLTIYGPSITKEHKTIELPILLFFRK